MSAARFSSIKLGDVVRLNGHSSKVLRRDGGSLRVQPLEGYTRYPMWIADARWYYERGDLTVVERSDHEW